MPARDLPRPRRADSFFGLHFDLHPQEKDTELGADATVEMVERLLRRVRPDYVQYDCKGHAGWTGAPLGTGWPSPGIVKDALAVWREATRRAGVALYIHYSGVWDAVAVRERPEWARIDEKGERDTKLTSTFGPYVDELLIPQLEELAEKYELDGVWVDGECWAVAPDYSPAALAAWKKATGLDEAPRKRGDAKWLEFLEFNRERFREYVRHYVDRLHATRPGFQVCSNWLCSTFMPEPVTMDVDFLSGDYSPLDSVATARLEARYLASTGRPWDLMAWGFNHAEGSGTRRKTAAHLHQEAAVVLSQGGGFQVYNQPTRAGWVDDTLVEVMADVAGFCRARKAVSFKTETVPQVALLLSTASFRERTDRLFAPWAGEFNELKGALDALLELGLSVDVLAEHQLLEPAGDGARLDAYPLLVIPECGALAPGFRERAVAYAERGGSVLVIGARAGALFKDNLGVKLTGEPAETSAYLEAGGMLAAASGLWQAVDPAGAEVVGTRFPALDARKGGAPAATLARVGKGRIAAVWGPLARRHHDSHQPGLRWFLGAIVRRLYPHPLVEMKAPPCVDLSLRRKGAKLLVHLTNTAGMQTAERHAVVDFIPPVGPVELAVRLPKGAKAKPKARVVGEKAKLAARQRAGALKVTLDRLDVHAVVEIG